MLQQSQKIKVALRYVSPRKFRHSERLGVPSIAGGVRGPGWYWALIDADGKTDDDWWFGPESTKDMARYVAEREDGYEVIP
jgi:hypothetical protein